MPSAIAHDETRRGRVAPCSDDGAHAGRPRGRQERGRPVVMKENTRGEGGIGALDALAGSRATLLRAKGAGSHSGPQAPQEIPRDPYTASTQKRAKRKSQGRPRRRRKAQADHQPRHGAGDRHHEDRSAPASARLLGQHAANTGPSPGKGCSTLELECQFVVLP